MDLTLSNSNWAYRGQVLQLPRYAQANRDVYLLNGNYYLYLGPGSWVQVQTESAQVTTLGGGGGTPGTVVNNTFSATPNFDLSAGVIQKITLTGNVTASTLSNIPVGTIVTFIIIQDGSGGHTFAWPTNLLGPATVDTDPSSVTIQSCIAYENTELYALSFGVTQ